MTQPLPDSVLADLRALDTPTVCNALEVVAPERRGHGYTTEPLVCVRPEMPPMVGYARTARIRARHPSGLSPAETRDRHLAYYTYMSEGPRPGVVVIQDLDAPSAGYGAWWGEVNSNVHRGLGCAGLVTDGSVRDLDVIAEDFQMLAGSVGPSHAFVHVVDWGSEVTVAGMAVRPGDLIHADRHGAVAVPYEVADRVKGAAELLAKREAVLIEAAKRPDFDIDQLKAAWTEMADIH